MLVISGNMMDTCAPVLARRMARSCVLNMRQVLEAEADAAAAQERVALGHRGAALGVLVGPEVQGADDDGPVAADLDDLAVGLVVVLLGGLGVGAEVEELGAVQADALAALVQDGGGLGGELDVAQERDLVAVLGDGGQVAQGVQAVDELHLLAASTARYSLDGPRVGVDDDHAAVAVDDDHVAAGGLGGDVVEAHHGRDAQRAGDDGRVAGLAAGVGGQAQDVLAVQAGRLTGREVVGQDDHLLAAGAPATGAAGR